MSALPSPFRSATATRHESEPGRAVDDHRCKSSIVPLAGRCGGVKWLAKRSASMPTAAPFGIRESFGAVDGWLERNGGFDWLKIDAARARITEARRADFHDHTFFPVLRAHGVHGRSRQKRGNRFAGLRLAIVISFGRMVKVHGLCIGSAYGYESLKSPLSASVCRKSPLLVPRTPRENGAPAWEMGLTR